MKLKYLTFLLLLLVACSAPKQEVVAESLDEPTGLTWQKLPSELSQGEIWIGALMARTDLETGIKMFYNETGGELAVISKQNESRYRVKFYYPLTGEEVVTIGSNKVIHFRYGSFDYYFRLHDGAWEGAAKKVQKPPQISLGMEQSSSYPR